MKTLSRCCFFLVFILFVTRLSWAQPVFSRFNPNNSVMQSFKVGCIEIDHLNQIWFGTLNGLYCYDGSRIKSYFSSPDSHSLKINVISDIYCDKNGKVWVSTGGFLHQYDAQHDCFKRINQKELVGYILFNNQKKNIQYVVDFYHVWKLDIRSGHLERMDQLGLDSTMPKYYVYEKGDSLLICTAQGLFLSVHENRATRLSAINTPFGFPLCERIVKCDENKILITTWGSGYFIYNLQTNQATHFFDRSLNSDISLGCLRNSDSTIWVGTNRGIIIHNFINHTRTHIYNDSLYSYGLYGSFIGDFAKDHQGNIWVGSNSGLEKYDPKLNNFTKRTLDISADRNFSKSILSYYSNANQEELIGTINGFCFHRNKNTFYETPENKKFKGEIYAAHLCTINGKTIGCFGKYLVELDLQKHIIKPIQKLSSEINSYAVGSNKDLWISTDLGGIYRFRDLKLIQHFDTTTAPLKLWSNTISAIAISEDSILAIAHPNIGLCLYHFKTNKYTSITKEKIPLTTFIPNKIEEYYFLSIQYHRSLFYVATRTNGLMIVNKDGHTAFYDNKNSNLPKSITNIEITSPFAYLKGSDGYYQFDLNTHVAKNILKGLPFNQNENFIAFAQDSVKVVVAYKNDLYTFHLNNDSPFYPTTRIADIFINEKRKTDDTKNYILNSGDNLRIEFTSNSYNLSQNNQYYYSINNEDWISTAGNAFIEFPNIGAGHYKIKILTETAFGLKDLQPLELEFKVLRPFYLRWWFIALLFIASVLLIYIYYRLKLEKQMESIHIRNNISRDLHDDMGSTLSAINIYSSLLKSSDKIPRQQELELFEKIEMSTKNAMEKMDDIIWMINPERDEAEDLIQRMKTHAYSILSNQQVSFEIDDNIKDLNFPGTIRKQVFLIYKEALNNALKHSQATHYHISWKKQNHHLILSISDNGRGIQHTPSYRKGNGFVNMNVRAKAIGGSLEVLSETSKGTTIVLSFNV